VGDARGGRGGAGCRCRSRRRHPCPASTKFRRSPGWGPRGRGRL